MTTRPAPHVDPGSRPVAPARLDRRLAATALVASTATAALLAFFVARPDLDPFREAANALGHTLAPGLPLAWLLLAVALLGVATAAVVLATGRQSSPVVPPVAVVQVVAFGVLAQGTGTLSGAGYLVSLAVPLLAVWAGAQVFRNRPAWRLPVAAAGVLAVVGIVAARDDLALWLGGVASGFARERWSLLAVLLPLATAAAWAGLAAVRAWRRGTMRRATAWVTRHRRLFTVVAALGPLPYALARLTWLTPWPQLSIDGELPLATRFQGMALGSAAWLGVVLTLGLILPWGEQLPRWFGRRAGRPVPPAAAIVPGGIVAVMLCGAAVPMLLLMGWVGAVYFPAWFWGPALALAVWGYAGHRYGVDDGTGVGPRSDGADVSAAGPARPAPAARR
ncbi:hypothetical protein M1843_12030 [Isoptericola sp. 4D.3]|uniref:Uncharacterized protein n=1 Tax=Isoptericola peretonis TaxID=2918523 RepID=A0ABT0J4R4_9MICO|nr:hypothetical protein [Isoptericola sp. 4D.3]